MRQPSATHADTTETYTFDPGSLSSAQRMGDACAICHTKWPRPRARIGELPDGATVFGCRECAEIIASHTSRTVTHALAAH
ncbi:hypothetical protein EFW17_10595 [Halostreptopolyspora alba]|uniref:Uncharacterized protein n=1 Tax=Halostreptopolyspora alba TaxID=2487137 RepID=A0A3N0EAH4_9ACTN|nr:hypothetical protein EFW17_10595 [Nocardiopsaceae bacterium YIM 96095]